MKLNKMIEKSKKYRKFLSNGLYLFTKDLHLNYRVYIHLFLSKKFIVVTYKKYTSNNYKDYI